MTTIKHIETKEYETFANNIIIEDYFKYIKENNGVTLENISEHFDKNALFVEIILGIWINHWNTFFKNGRVIKDDEMYYCLSPKNPNVLKINHRLY